MFVSLKKGYKAMTNNIGYKLKVAFPFILILFCMLIFIFSPNKLSFIISSLKPIFESFVIAYLLDSLVKFIMKTFKMGRNSSIYLSCIALLCVILIVFSIFIPILIENAESVVAFITSYNMDISSIIADIANRIDHHSFYRIAAQIEKISVELKGKINDFLNKVVLSMINSAGSIMASIISILTSFILSIYMLIEKDELTKKIKRLILALFNQKNSNAIIDIAKSANKIFKSYIVGKILDSLIVGLIIISAFLIFKIPYAFLMGSIIAIFNIIPFFGPIIGSVPVIVITFFISPVKALIVLIITIVVGQIDGNFIEPKIVSSNVGITPFWAISGVVIGGSTFGIIGMILGVPVLVLIKNICEKFVEKRLREKDML